jgi:hypothetical protein
MQPMAQTTQGAALAFEGINGAGRTAEMVSIARVNPFMGLFRPGKTIRVDYGFAKNFPLRNPVRLETMFDPKWIVGRNTDVFAGLTILPAPSRLLSDITKLGFNLTQAISDFADITTPSYNILHGNTPGYTVEQHVKQIYENIQAKLHYGDKAGAQKAIEKIAEIGSAYGWDEATQQWLKGLDVAAADAIALANVTFMLGEQYLDYNVIENGRIIGKVRDYIAHHAEIGEIIEKLIDSGIVRLYQNTNIITVLGDDGDPYDKIMKSFLTTEDLNNFSEVDLGGRYKYVYPVEYKMIMDKNGNPIHPSKYKQKEDDIRTHKRIKTILISQTPLTFDGRLVLDSFDNLYVDKNGKQTMIYTIKTTVTDIAAYNNIPVVTATKVPSVYAALKWVATIMGYSSLGRLNKDYLVDDYGGLFESTARANSVLTALGTSIYLTNLAVLLVSPLIKKLGSKKVLNIAQGLGIGGLLLPPTVYAIEMNPVLRLALVIASLISIGMGSSIIQQILNPMGRNILHGKEASYATSSIQLRKSIGSLLLYISAFFMLRVFGFSSWTALFIPLLIPSVISLISSNKADLPHTPPTTKSREMANKNDNVNSDISAWGALTNLMKDKIISLIFFGTLLFCGSEMVASVATKEIIKSLEITKLLFGKEDSAVDILITGIVTMLPIMLGRGLATKLSDTYKTENKNGKFKLNEKLMFLSAVFALAGPILLKIWGPGAGLLGLIPFFISNLGFANLFGLLFNIAKDHQKNATIVNPETGNAEKKFGADIYGVQIGTISTVALTACWFMPILASLIFPGSGAEVVFNRLYLPIVLVSLGILLNLKHFKVNPLNWKKRTQKKHQTNNDNLVRYINKLREEQLATETSTGDVENVYRNFENNLAAKLNVSVKDLRSFLVGKEMPNVQDALAKNINISQDEIAMIKRGQIPSRITEEIINALLSAQ